MKPFNMRWRGMLTTGNANEITKLFKTLLNRRRFTYTQVRPSLLPAIGPTCPQMIETRVDVHTRQKLVIERQRQVPAIRVSFDQDGKSATIVVSLDSYLCMFQTNLVGESAAYDHTYKNPYITFDGDRVTIKWQTPCGDQAVDVFTLEVR